jgi:hypothetical protein
MSNPEDEQGAAGLPPGGISLGGLRGGEFDTSLTGGEAPQAPELPADDERLGLPRGALVAFRKSGGLRFTSRGVVVTRRGWVEPLSGTPGRRRRITDEALATLERLLLQSGLARLEKRPRSATRDGYAYEIAAHVGGRLRQVELTDPVPAEDERLVRALTRLLPRDE